LRAGAPYDRVPVSLVADRDRTAAEAERQLTGGIESPRGRPCVATFRAAWLRRHHAARSSRRDRTRWSQAHVARRGSARLAGRSETGGLHPARRARRAAPVIDRLRSARALVVRFRSIGTNGISHEATKARSCQVFSSCLRVFVAA